MLTINQLAGLLDWMAGGVPVFESSIGLDGSVPGTLSWGANSDVATLTAINDRTVQADLVPAFTKRLKRYYASSLYSAINVRDVQRALDIHLSSAGGLTEFLRANAKQVHPNLLKIGMLLDPDVLFAPTAIDPMATFTVTGSGAGTFTSIGQIDVTKYGNSKLQVRTTTAIGAQINATIRTEDRGGTQTDQPIVVAAGSGADAAIGVLAVRGTRVVSITITGGTIANQFRVVSQVERDIGWTWI